jgi:hypothetical protein
MKYTLLCLEVLAHRVCSAGGWGLFLQNSDTRLPVDFLHKITYVFIVSIRSARPQHRTILDVSPVVTVTNWESVPDSSLMLFLPLCTWRLPQLWVIPLISAGCRSALNTVRQLFKLDMCGKQLKAVLVCKAGCRYPVFSNQWENMLEMANGIK